ncbi:MAG: hypothetical protein DRP42_02490 [Tenericutes bacterium]|nr:MAG: hypothetical protein DRP42_02490 [Mycoplasmatota bacterium]
MLSWVSCSISIICKNLTNLDLSNFNCSIT